ncbi:MAG: EF-hand domain-containing protein [Xanthomonadales bacterium]|nr:EF-hand domain-containing protein [Xanthomonadales bacterium]
MKSLEKTVFEFILIIATVVAIAMLPLAAHAGQGMQHKPPSFAEIDKDGDGFVSEAEFDTHRAERHAAMAEAGKPMKGMATAPSFAEVDSDGDGKLTEAELTAAQKAHMKAMREAHRGMGMHKGMKMPTFKDLDLDGDGCISAEEFAKHQPEMHM